MKKSRLREIIREELQNVITEGPEVICPDCGHPMAHHSKLGCRHWMHVFHDVPACDCKRKNIDEAGMGDAHKAKVPVYDKDRKKILGYVSKLATSIGASKLAGKGHSAMHSKVDGKDAWVIKEEEAWRAGRNRKHYRPDLKKSEIDKIVARLKKDGYGARAHPPYITTNAPEDKIDGPEG